MKVYGIKNYEIQDPEGNTFFVDALLIEQAEVGGGTDLIMYLADTLEYAQIDLDDPEHDAIIDACLDSQSTTFR
jgi:hypothetical protein